MEQLSRSGADKIAAMEVSERTKRAMLAETIEDRIFVLTEQLEGYVEEDGTVLEEHREVTVEIALQTKALQRQYRELVTGEPSSILDTLEAAMKPDENS
jgi:hypothetical protein